MTLEAIVSGAIAAAFAPAAAVKRCGQCWKVKPFPTSFIGRRGVPVRMCVECQARYYNWTSLSLEERAARMAKHRPAPRAADGPRVTFVLRSGNRKTGPIPVTMTDASSCPESCAFSGGRGCYAAFGKLGFHWRNATRDGLTWRDLCAAIAALPAGTLWRHNEAGDLPGTPAGRLDVRRLNELVRANRGRRGFTFTHRHPRTHREREALRAASRAGFAVNLSADSIAEADRLAALEAGPVAVVLPADAPARASRTPGGRTVIVCPAQTHGLTCERCRLCAHASRKAVVGFRAHGQSQALVTSIVRGAKG